MRQFAVKSIRGLILGVVLIVATTGCSMIRNAGDSGNVSLNMALESMADYYALLELDKTSAKFSAKLTRYAYGALVEEVPLGEYAPADKTKVCGNSYLLVSILYDAENGILYHTATINGHGSSVKKRVMDIMDSASIPIHYGTVGALGSYTLHNDVVLSALCFAPQGKAITAIKGDLSNLSDFSDAFIVTIEPEP
jgi:hypothetical protein